MMPADKRAAVEEARMTASLPWMANAPDTLLSTRSRDMVKPMDPSIPTVAKCRLFICVGNLRVCTCILRIKCTCILLIKSIYPSDSSGFRV